MYEDFKRKSKCESDVKMTDRNGYNKSILNTVPGRDYITGYTGETCRHEIYGAANRRLSKAEGFWVNLLPEVHNKVHLNPDCNYDRFLKEICQREYEKTHSREEFRKLIGKSYL